MSQYTKNHASSLQDRAYAILDFYNKDILNNEMTEEKWNSVFMENSSIMGIILPDSPHLSWEKLNHKLLNVQINLLTEMGIYCTKEIVLTLWGLDLAALYYANPNEKSLDKLLFATELICYAEASLSVTLFNNRPDFKNLFVTIKAKPEKRQNSVGFEDYFSEQGNVIKYWRKIPIYKALVNCLLKDEKVKSLLDSFSKSQKGEVSIDTLDNDYKNLKKTFNVSALLRSDALAAKLKTIKKQEEKTNKTQQEASRLIETGMRESLRAPTKKLIEILPDCFYWAEEDKIPLKYAFIREIKNGALYNLTSTKGRSKKR